MTKLFFIFFMFFVSYNNLTKAQRTNNIFFCGYGNNNNNTELCDYLKTNSFTTNEDAAKAVDKILRPLGLPHNFVLVSCPRIRNAVAVTPKDGIRYIVYDNEFMQGITKATTNWSNLSILAHEIGHHLCGHTLIGATSLADQRLKELEADEFSGFIMYKLGATLTQAEAAVMLLSNNRDDKFSTHPSLSKRVTAISKGYNKSKAEQPINTTSSKIETKPSSENYFQKGYELFMDKDYYGAIEKFSKAIEINPMYDRAYVNRGACKANLKDYDGALKDATYSIKINPELPIAYYNRGIAFYNLNRFDDAFKDFSLTIQLDPENADAYNMRGLTYEEFNQMDKALSDYNKAILYDPLSEAGYGNRGRIRMYQSKDYRGALQDFNRAIELNPEAFNSYSHRGELKLTILKDYNGAINDYTKAIEFDAQNPKYFINRGTAKSLLGDNSGGCNDYRVACNLGLQIGCDNYKDFCR